MTAHPARAGFEPLWDLLSGIFDQEARQRARLSEATRARILAEVDLNDARTRGDTRSIGAARKALKAARNAELRAELPFLKRGRGR